MEKNMYAAIKDGKVMRVFSLSDSSLCEVKRHHKVGRYYDHFVEIKEDQEPPLIGWVFDGENFFPAPPAPGVEVLEEKPLEIEPLPEHPEFEETKKALVNMKRELMDREHRISQYRRAYRKYRKSAVREKDVFQEKINEYEQLLAGFKESEDFLRKKNLELIQESRALKDELQRALNKPVELVYKEVVKIEYPPSLWQRIKNWWNS